MDNVVPVPMRLVEPLRPRQCSRPRRRLLPLLRMRGRGGVPKCEGFAFAEAHVGSGATEHQRRDSALSYLHSSAFSSDCAEEIYSSEGSCCSLSCSVTTEACDCREDDMNEIEVRGPASIAMSRPASTRATTPGSKTALSPPVVCPGRSLELTTRLGMARLKAEMEAAAATDVPKVEREEARGRLKSAKLRPLGYIPIDMQPRAACIGITPVSDLPSCPSPRPRSSTEVARQQSSTSTVEQQLHTRSQSGHVTRQRQPFLSISRDSGAVASTKAPHQKAVSSPESTPEPEQRPSTRQVRLHPEAIPHKISSPIPHNCHEEVEAGSSFSVRGYSSPPSETPPTAAQLPLVIPSHTCTPQLLGGAESEHKPSRVAMVVSARPPAALTTLRPNSSFRHRSSGAPESTSPTRKLHPLRGCVSPQPLAAVKGFRLHTSPPSQSEGSKEAAPPPSPPTGGQSTALPHNTPLTLET